MLKKIKFKYNFKKIVIFISEGKKLKLFKYNKALQKRLDLSINDYDNYSHQIVIEIIPINKINDNKIYKFINITEDEYLYHIYFNEEKKESDRTYMTRKDNAISKIKIVLDKEINSLKELFCDCKGIKEIKFIKFIRKNILDMSYMFYGCSNLIKLDLSNFKTNNVINMSSMFRGCESLKYLSDISKWKTHNVTNMSDLFSWCKSLKSIPDISKWNVENVIDMSFMFNECESLKSLPDLSKWKLEDKTDTIYMFHHCKSLNSIPFDFSNNNNNYPYYF